MIKFRNIFVLCMFYFFVSLPSVFLKWMVILFTFGKKHPLWDYASNFYLYSKFVLPLTVYDSRNGEEKEVISRMFNILVILIAIIGSIYYLSIDSDLFFMTGIGIISFCFGYIAEQWTYFFTWVNKHTTQVEFFAYNYILFLDGKLTNNEWKDVCRKMSNYCN